MDAKAGTNLKCIEMKASYGLAKCVKVEELQTEASAPGFAVAVPTFFTQACELKLFVRRSTQKGYSPSNLQDISMPTKPIDHLSDNGYIRTIHSHSLYTSFSHLSPALARAWSMGSMRNPDLAVFSKSIASHLIDRICVINHLFQRMYLRIESKILSALLMAWV